MPTPCYFLSVNILGYDAEVFVNGARIGGAGQFPPGFAKEEGFHRKQIICFWEIMLIGARLV